MASKKLLQYQFELMSDDSKYTACFCEENVYHLATKCVYLDPATKCESFVVFISSMGKKTPIYCQKSSRNNEVPVLWDYHVVLFVREKSEDGSIFSSAIFDFDTTLPFPCKSSRYILKSFRPHYFLPREHQQTFRVIPVNDFVNYFASDRSHVADAPVPHPAWPLIKGEKATSDMNIHSYINMGVTTDTYSGGMAAAIKAYEDAQEGREVFNDLTDEQKMFGEVYLLTEFMMWAKFDADDAL